MGIVIVIQYYLDIIQNSGGQSIIGRLFFMYVNFFIMPHNRYTTTVPHHLCSSSLHLLIDYIPHHFTSSLTLFLLTSHPFHPPRLLCTNYSSPLGLPTWPPHLASSFSFKFRLHTWPPHLASSQGLPTWPPHLDSIVGLLTWPPHLASSPTVVF